MWAESMNSNLSAGQMGKCQFKGNNADIRLRPSQSYIRKWLTWLATECFWGHPMSMKINELKGN